MYAPSLFGGNYAVAPQPNSNAEARRQPSGFEAQQNENLRPLTPAGHQPSDNYHIVDTCFYPVKSDK
jgi:hypothetical protein